jgi:multidrug transporter EmrE-like cation transporter
MDLQAYVLLIIAILFGVVGQLMLKKGMARHPNFRVQDLMLLISDVPVVAGFLSYGVSSLLYFKVLANLDLSLAYPTVSLGYVFVVFLSNKLFKEKVTLSRWTAVFIICIGVTMVGFGGR